MRGEFVGRLGDRVKDIVGIEGKFGEWLAPKAHYTSANITIGGAGYPLGQFHQQFLSLFDRQARAKGFPLQGKACFRPRPEVKMQLFQTQ